MLNQQQQLIIYNICLAKSEPHKEIFPNFHYLISRVLLRDIIPLLRFLAMLDCWLADLYNNSNFLD